MNIIKRIKHEEAKEFAKTCELKVLNVDKNNSYYGLFIDNKLVSIASYKRVTSKDLRLKSNYTLAEYRRKGYCTLLIKTIMKYNPSEIYTAYCEESSLNIYLNLGFKLVKIRQNKNFNSFFVKLKGE